jgi:hypothetical protein
MNISIAHDKFPELPAESAASQVEFSVLEIHGIEALRSYQSMLVELATESIEPNPFYEPWMLLPALENYARCTQSMFLLVMARNPRDGNCRLSGFFPLEVRRRFRGVPLRHVALWQHPHCFLATPLLLRSFVRQSLQTLVAWFQTNRCYSLLQLNLVSGEGDFHQQFKALLDSHPWRTLEQRYERAFFHPAKDAETYLNMTMSKKSAKEYDRLFRRLSERGDLQWETLSPELSPVVNPAAVPISAWINDFLGLEASGWKGRSCTALRSSAAGDAFFRAIATEAFKRQRLLILALRLDRRPIAMIAVLLQGRGGYAFKLAYDETYRLEAPDVLLLKELNRRLHGQQNLAWLDSCAAPDNVLGNRMWLDRRPLCNLLVAKRFSLGAGVLRILPMLSQIKKNFIRWPGLA